MTYFVRNLFTWATGIIEDATKHPMLFFLMILLNVVKAV